MCNESVGCLYTGKMKEGEGLVFKNLVHPGKISIEDKVNFPTSISFFHDLFLLIAHFLVVFMSGMWLLPDPIKQNHLKFGIFFDNLSSSAFTPLPLSCFTLSLLLLLYTCFRLWQPQARHCLRRKQV